MSQVLLSCLTALVTTSFALWYGHRWWSRRQFKIVHGCQDCSQFPHRDLLGYDLFKATAAAMMSGNFLKFRQHLYSEFGKTYSARFWIQKQINTMEAENMQSVYVLDFESYGVEDLRLPTSGDWLGRGIFTTDGAYWRHSRDAIKPIFARAQISDLPSFAKHVDKLLQMLPTDGSTIDLQPLFLRMYLDHSTEFLFGFSTNTLGPGQPGIDAEKFVNSFDDALRGVGRNIPLGKWLSMFTRYDREFIANCRESQSFVEDCIDKAVERKNTSNLKENTNFVFIDELLKRTHDRKYLRDQLLNIFFPARDSAALGISLVFFQLARNPKVWSKVRSEVASIEDLPSFEKLKSLKYLQSTLSEALRLETPAGAAMRTCVKDTVLPRGGGKTGREPILVTKGTNIRTDWDLMQRDQGIWGNDAEVFRPERWADIEQPQWKYMPFMIGNRVCPAKQWILCQYAYIILRFAKRYEIVENRDPTVELVEEIRMTKQSRNGVQVSLRSS